MPRARMGKRILITGGTGRSGEAAVRLFSAQGASVAFFHEEDGGLMLAKETGSISIRCSSSDYRAVKGAALVAENYFDGKLDTLICCTDAGGRHAAEDPQGGDWHRILDENLSASYYVIHAMVPALLASGRGSIILLSSLTGLRGMPGSAAMSAVSAGLAGLTRSLARDLGPKGIRVNCILTGWSEEEAEELLSEEEREAILAATPLGRMAKEEDFVHVMQFLASEKAGFLTGQVIEVSGGYLL